MEHYAQVVASTLPAEADRATCQAAQITSGLGQADPGPEPTGPEPTGPEPSRREPTHGDFYETQILVDRGRLTGLLDVDTVGPGRRADDLACLVAHTEVLAQIEPEHAATTAAVTERMVREFDRRVDPVELRLRVAGVLMSLATGPYRVQEAAWAPATAARLDLVQRWLDRAAERAG